MKMNRRNVVVGLGTIVAGGGAALGSGAFSTASADRTLDVNVVTNTDIAADFVDIVLHVGDHSSIALGTDDDDPVNLFPDSGDTYESDFSPSDTDVSLMQNDVTIVVGPDGSELPPNATVSYTDLFTVVNDDGSTSQAFDVKFEATGGPSVEFNGASNAQSASYTANLGTGGDTEAISTDINTGGSNDSGTLEITITEA
ncbi:hypothetical protein [Natrinema salinisoli]|uniref:hypothetical protein n=1 Tax=Natrinema salinisoli TaxID=2878535 RepID=UPI001CEFD822|nr:hypothetical protein [Natrinema salinisoli]